jgi:hypothetical protein
MHGTPCGSAVFDYRVPCGQIFIKFSIINIVCILLYLCMICSYSAVPMLCLHPVALLYGLFVSSCVSKWFVCILLTYIVCMHPVASLYGFFVSYLSLYMDSTGR